MKVKVTDAQEQDYQDEQDRVRDEMESLGEMLANGRISPEDFKQRMRDLLLDYYIAIALIASDGKFDNPEDLAVFLNATYGLLDDMVETVRTGDFSDRYVMWRAGIFSFSRGVFTRYSIPDTIWDNMPALPGIDCLGDGACGCTLEWETREDGSIAVYWLLGMTEHCVVCLEAAANMNPYIIGGPE